MTKQSSTPSRPEMQVAHAGGGARDCQNGKEGLKKGVCNSKVTLFKMNMEMCSCCSKLYDDEGPQASSMSEDAGCCVWIRADVWREARAGGRGRSLTRELPVTVGDYRRC